MRQYLSSVFAATLLCGCSSAVVVSGRPSPTPAPRGNSESVHALGIPPGHLPRPGQCRVWIPGTPPGRQARARSCAGILSSAPAGSWILYRPTTDRHYVHVRVVDPRRVGVLVSVRIFIASSGVYVSEREPGQGDRDDDDDRGRGRGRGAERPAE